MAHISLVLLVSCASVPPLNSVSASSTISFPEPLLRANRESKLENDSFSREKFSNDMCPNTGSSQSHNSHPYTPPVNHAP